MTVRCFHFLFSSLSSHDKTVSFASWPTKDEKKHNLANLMPNICRIFFVILQPPHPPLQPQTHRWLTTLLIFTSHVSLAKCLYTCVCQFLTLLLRSTAKHKHSVKLRWGKREGRQTKAERVMLSGADKWEVFSRPLLCRNVILAQNFAEARCNGTRTHILQAHTLVHSLALSRLFFQKSDMMTVGVSAWQVDNGQSLG